MVESGVFAAGNVARREETCELLLPEALSVLASLKLPGRKETLSPSEFIEHLFARAPRELLRLQPSAELARITSEALCILEEIATARNKVAIKATKGLEGSALFIALPDCPFIISSIAERLAEARVTVETFQHPIFVFQDTPVALSYIEISEPDQPSDLSALVTALQVTLASLEIIVADFDAMRSAAADSLLKHKRPFTPSSCGDLANSEIKDFARWLVDGSFFFLGTARWGLNNSLECSDERGVFRTNDPCKDTLATEVREDIQALLTSEHQLSIRKCRTSSPVHRPATVLNILIKDESQPPSVFSISGYLTSKAWAHESEDIPILRLKVAKVVNYEGLLPNTHDYKYRIEVIDNMPTDEALSMPETDMAEIAQLALGLFSSQSMRTKFFTDALRRRVLTVIILPTERYSAAVRNSIQTTLEKTLRAPPGCSDVHLDSSKRRQLRLYISTPLPRDFSGILPEEILARSFVRAALTWEEQFAEALPAERHEYAARGVFPQDYQAATEIREATADWEVIETLSPAQPSAVSLFAKPESPKPPVLSVFSLGSTISISQATPVLENIGLEVLSAHSYPCSFKGRTIFLLKLTVRPYDGEALTSASFNAAVAPGLTEILRGHALNDPLNLLLRRTRLTVRNISVLRAYCAMLWQVKKISTKRTMWEALAGSPRVAAELFSLFETMFNPALSITSEARQSAMLTHHGVIRELLRQVPDISHDRVLRSLFSLVQNTVRTNFYTGSDTLAFKITPQKIEFMPHPRPLFEIFVFSSRIEGTHLRSATVARGGIRWSDRIDDYRAEVLGLMKTQRVKNVIIVPSGAKGGFVVKQLPSDPEQISGSVERAYREYITALLTLADNEVNGTVTHPPTCIVHDGPDPYFVVAADKGTATFSDVANSIAQQDFSFWLGDAFASGGSNGYDHKKYGITAKGGWECVLRHFRDSGIDYEAKPFTVVGIGDMSGDVFGNAMLLSKNIALIAAFNHKHIFLDPNPNTADAFAERARLFTTPRTQWSDFNPQLISTGGGVFNRFDKEITLSQEARKALGLSDDVPATLDGETLITLILKAPIDLLWNGGIGTYVKASSESHADVNDGTNDRVRINADELRARVVGEGGNLGFTQRARIEFALQGGRINTDAIDNSGGVDLSDHEVNLKLLLNRLVRAGSLQVDERNNLLKDIALDVVESVLQHNRSQALMLTIAQQGSLTGIEHYRTLIREMNKLGYLDRSRDYLPEDEELDERTSLKTGLMRPELAFCSAAVKMWIKEVLCKSELCLDPCLEDVAMNYFPPAVRERFPDSIREHPLRREIVASELANEIVSAVGIPFLYATTSTTGIALPALIASLIAADRIVGLKHLRKELHSLDQVGDSDRFLELWKSCGEALQKATIWLLGVHGTSTPLPELIALYQPGFQLLLKDGIANQKATAQGLTQEASAHLTALSDVVNTLEILWTAREYKQSGSDVARVLKAVLTASGMEEILASEHTIRPSNKWEQELARVSYDEMRRALAKITGHLCTKQVTDPTAIALYLQSIKEFAAFSSTVSDVMQRMTTTHSIELAALPVVARQLWLIVSAEA
jgi:glutamate dehydrogenase